MPFSINPSERNLGLSEMSDDRRKQLRIQRRISAKLRVMRRVDEFIARQREDQRMIADQLRLLRATNEKREHSSLQNCSLEQEQPMNQQCQQGVEEGRVPLNEHTRLRLSDIRIQSDTEDSSSSSHNDSQENSGEPKRRWKEMIAENGVSERELKRLRSARNISDFDGGNHRLLLLAEAGAELLLELERSKRGPVSNDRDHNQEATPTLQSMPEKIQCGSVRNDQDHDREGTPSLQNMHEKSQCGLVRNGHDHHHQEVTPLLQNMPEKSQCGSVGNDQDQRQEGALSSQNMPENSQHGSVRNDQDHHREGSSSIQNILEKSQHGSARNDRDHHQGGAPSLQNMPEKSQHGSVRNDQDHHQDVEQSIQNMPEKTHCGSAINDQDHDGSMRLENTCMQANSTDQTRVDHQLLAINTVHNSDAGNSNLRIRGRIRLSDIKRLARLGNARPIGDINVIHVQEQVLHSSERDNHNAPRVVEHAPCSHNDVAMKCTEQKQAIGQDHNNPPSVTMDNDIAMEHTEQQKQELDHVRERVNRQGEEAMEHTEQQKQELGHVRERVNQQGDEDQNNPPSVTTNHDACTHNDVAMEHTEQHKQEMDTVRDRVNWQGDEDDHNVPSAKCASDNFHAPSLVSKHVEQVQQEKDSKDHNNPPSVTTNHDACAHNDVAMEHIEQQKQDMDHVREQVNRQGDEGNHNVLSAICSSNNFHAPSLVTKHLEQVQQEKGSKVPTNGLNSQILEGMNTKQACRGMDYKHVADDHNSPSVEKHDACSHNDVAMKRTEQQQQEMGKDNHNPLSVTTDHNACTRNDVAMEHTKRQKQEMDHVREQINLQIDEGNHNVLSTKCASDNFHAPSLTTFMNHDARTHIDVAMEHTKRQKQEMDHVREQIYLQSDEDNHNVLSANCASDNFHGPSLTTKQAEQVQQEKVSEVSTNDLNSQILEGMNMEQAWRDMEHKQAAGERWQQGIVITQLQERNREDQDLRVQQHQPEITNELIQLPGVQIMQEPSAPPCCCTIAQEGAAPPYCCTILQWHTAPHLTEDQLREHQRSIAREKRLERTNKLRNPQRNPASFAEQQLEELKTTWQGRVFNIARQQRLEKRREQRKRLEAARQQRNLMIDQQRDKQFELENNPHQSIENNQYPEDQYHEKQLDAALLEGNAEVITDNLRVQGKTRLIQIRRQARLIYEEQIESQSDKDDGRTQAVEAMNEETMHGEIKCQSDAGQSSLQPCHSSSEESQEMKLCRLAFEHQQTQQLRMRIIRRCMAVSQQTVLTSPEHKQKLRELQSIIARQEKLIRINNWRKQERGRQCNAVRKQRHQMTDEQREKIREAQRQWLLRRAHVVREQCLLAAEQRQEQRIEEVNASLNLLEHLSGSDAGRTHNLLVQLEGRFNFHQTIENDQSLQGQQSMEELNSTRVNINIEVENGRTRLNQIRHQARVRYTHSLEIDVGHSHEQLTLQNNEHGKNICQPIVPRDELLREYACRGSTSDRA